MIFLYLDDLFLSWVPLKYPYRDWIEAVTNSLNIPTFSPQAKYITEAEKKYNILLKSLDPQLSLNYQKRCEEATKEGNILFWRLW